MGKTTKKESVTNGSELANAPTVVESAQDTDVAEAATDVAPPKAKRTRVYRGQECEVIKVTKNTRTGAIYDLIEVTRNVTNRRSGDVVIVKLGKKLRRPGTGVEPVTDEIVIEEEE
jgi:hypothetical protein